MNVMLAPADQRERDQLQRRGSARARRARSRRRSRGGEHERPQAGRAARGHEQPADDRADAHRRGHEAEARRRRREGRGGHHRAASPGTRRRGSRRAPSSPAGSRAPACGRRSAGPRAAGRRPAAPAGSGRSAERSSVQQRRDDGDEARRVDAGSRRPRRPWRSGCRRPPGPTTRATLTSTELRLTALRRCSGPTISSMNDWRAGFSKALLRPSSAASTPISQTRTSPVTVSSPSTSACTPIALCRITISRRLSTRSAITPP